MKLFQSVYLQVCKELEMQQALRSTVNVFVFFNSSHVNCPSWLPVIYRTRLSYLCLLWIYCKWILNPLETTKPWQAAFNENWHSLLNRPTLLSILQVNKEKKSNKYHWYLIFITRKTNPYTLRLIVIHLHPYTYAKKKKKKHKAFDKNIDLGLFH